MRILFLSDNFPPEVNAPASRTFEHCRHWVEAGHQVTVITCAPNFPQGKVHPGYRNRLYQRSTVDGITVIRAWSFISANEGFLKRVLDHLSFALTSFVIGLFQRCDIIVATSPQFFTTWSAWALARLKQRPWVFEVRDLWPATIAALGTIRSGRLLRLLERIELALYRDSALTIVVTNAFRDDLVARGIDPAKVKVVSNGVDLGAFAARPKDAALVEQLGLAGKTVVGYIGTHGACQGLGFVIDAAARVEDPSFHFLFVGAGAERQSVIERASALGLANVSFLPSVAKDEVARYIGVADVMLVPLRRSEVFETVVPSKIFEAAALERPILLGVDGEARQIVERFGAGLFYVPEDQPSFLAALKRISDGGAALERMKAGCGELAAAYDRRRLAGEMVAHLEKAAKR